MLYQRRMQIVNSALLVSCLALAAAGCASDSPDDDGTSMGGVALRVNSAATIPRVATYTPPSGTTYVRLEVTLENKASTTPVRTEFPLFSLQTDRAILLSPSVHTAALQDACVSGTSLATGGSRTCRLLFELPAGQVPERAVYDAGGGVSASVAIPAVTGPSACEAYQYATPISNTCGDCMNARCAAELDASYRSMECLVANNSTCRCDEDDSPDAICACKESCLPATCWSMELAVYSCVATKCGSECT